MSLKIHELIQTLEAANFVRKRSQAGYKNLQHPKGINITLCGELNNQAKQYQINDVKRALELIKNE